MDNTFIRRVVLYAVAAFLFVFALDGIIFLASHLPTKTFSFDTLLLRLGGLEQFFRIPRRILRMVWPSESTPVALNFILSLLNWLCWGVVLALLKNFWDKARR